MNVESVLSVVKHEVPNFTEIVPYSQEKVQKCLHLPSTGTDGGALEAVKLDPAVLEAQVTVDAMGAMARPSSLMQAFSATHQPTTDHTQSEKRESRLQSSSFERAVMMSKAALLSLTPAQYQLLMQYAATLRRQRVANQIQQECAFCKNNGESLAWYSSHALKSWRGRVCCPVLRAYRCPRCGATGDRAHTLKYCRHYNETDTTSSYSF